MSTSQSVSVQRNPIPISGGSEDCNNEVVSNLRENQEVSGQTTQTRGTKRKPSVVWEHFTKQNDTHAQCNHCDKLLTTGGGTSHIKKHLKTACPNYRLIEPGDIRVVSPRTEFVFDQSKSREYLAKMVMKHNYPFNIGDHEYAELFCGSLNPDFKLPCRNTIIADVINVFEEEKVKVYKLLSELKSKVSLTTDIWGSGNTGVSYCCLTSHFIDENWNLNKKILSFKYLPYKHDGDSLFKFMREEITNWNLNKKLCSVVVDNATANDVMTRKLIDWIISDSSTPFCRELFHVRCSAHILNLIVQDGLKQITDFLENIRETVRYLKRSPAGRQKLDQVKNQCEARHLRKIAMDVPNRWNSTFDMLQTTLPLREALGRLEIIDQHYVYNPNSWDWDAAEVVLDCLRIFYEATRHFSGRMYPTSNVFFRDICQIHLKMIDWGKSSNDILILMHDPMKEKFDKYWDECSLALAVAVVFDPRFKMQLVKYFFNKIYGLEGASTYIQRVSDSLHELFIFYGGTVPSSLNETVMSSDFVENDTFDVDFDRWCDNALPSSDIEKSELDAYLDEKKFPTTVNEFDILNWWKTNNARYPVLARIARDILAVPATTVASEAAFSVGGRVLDPQRSSMLPDALEALIVGGDWLPMRKNTSYSDVTSETEADRAIRL